MLFFPVVMNAIQYYIIDSFIKDQKPLDHEPVPSEEEEDDEVEDDGQGRRRSEGVEHDGADESEDGDGTSKNVSEVKVTDHEDNPRLRIDSKKLDEYNPAHDGEGSGSSGEREVSRSPSKDNKAKEAESSAKQA